MKQPALLLAFLLVSCATPQTADQRAQEIAYHYMPECGGVPDNQTDGDRWRNCIKRAYERDQALRQAAAYGAAADAMQQMNRNNQQTLQNMLPKPATNCTTQWLLGTAYTRCQ